eukprot:scaffold162924_cov28-Tisochrysis_lutea.AAC.1
MDPSRREGAAGGTAAAGSARSSSKLFFRPLQLVGYSLTTPLFSVEQFEKSASDFTRPPLLQEGDAELLAAASTELCLPTAGVSRRERMLPESARLECTTEASSASTAVVEASSAAEPSAAVAIREGRSSPTVDAFTTGRVVPSCSSTTKLGVTSIQEDPGAHPLRSARPTTWFDIPRRATFPRNYTPDHNLADLSPEARSELLSKARSQDRESATFLCPGQTVLLLVAVYEGRLRHSVWMVHGDQTLLDIRAKLKCSSTQNLQARVRKAAQQQLPGVTSPSSSSMFWIEGTFYVDGQHDLSCPVREWCARQHKIVKPLDVPAAADASVPMSAVRLKHLNIQIGVQYLFVHDGACQHALVFEACSLLSSFDDVRPNM